MNDVDSSNTESENNLDNWKSSTPEEFLATMLHELRNPMMIIKGWVGILSDEKPKNIIKRLFKAFHLLLKKLKSCMKI